MKILHISDIHLDSALTSKLPSGKVRERRGELFATFRRLLDKAEELGCRVVIIAGDLFDTDRITRRCAERALACMELHPRVDVLYLPGNHERQALMNCGASLPENLRIFGEDWTYFDYEGLRIGGASRIGEGTLGTFQKRRGALSVGVLHGTLADRSAEGGYIGTKDFDSSDIDYLALGHYHSYGAYSTPDGRSAVYCGAPEGRGFDEVGKKGFVIIDAEDGRISHSFTPFAYRTLHSIVADISTAQRVSEADRIIEGLIGGIPREDIVRLTLVGRRPPELTPDSEGIRLRYRDRFYYFELKDESRIRISKEDYMYDKSVKGEFIRLVQSDTSLSDSDRERIIRLGLSALIGEGAEI